MMYDAVLKTREAWGRVIVAAVELALVVVFVIGVLFFAMLAGAHAQICTTNCMPTAGGGQMCQTTCSPPPPSPPPRS